MGYCPLSISTACLQYGRGLYSHTDGLSDIFGLTAGLDSRRPRAIFLISLHLLDTVASGT